MSNLLLHNVLKVSVLEWFCKLPATKLTTLLSINILQRVFVQLPKLGVASSNLVTRSYIKNLITNVL